MNIILWVLQILLGLGFVAFGFNHGFNVEKGKERPGMSWMGAVPRGLMYFIGVCEILGGLGLVLPALTGILPVLTPIAATLLAVVMGVLGEMEPKFGSIECLKNKAIVCETPN